MYGALVGVYHSVDCKFFLFIQPDSKHSLTIRLQRPNSKYGFMLCV